MKREKVTIDLSKLLTDTVNLKYRKSFGAVNGELKYTLVTEANARFVNLFGLSVDVDSGDIALGYFPNSERYIVIGDFYQMMYDCMFIPKKRKDNKVRYLFDDDLKYLLEGLKINPVYRSEHMDDIQSMVDDRQGRDLKYDSIILNLVDKREARDIPENVKEFLSRKDGTWVRDLIVQCLELSGQYESIARDYFGNFISESYESELFGASKDDIVTLIEAKKPNLNALILKYLSYGVPIEFLLAMKSYGFGIKQRRAFLPTSGRGGPSYNSLPKEQIMRIGEKISSLVYVEVGTVEDSLVRAYNVLDLVKTVDAEPELMFSYDFLEAGNAVLYGAITKRLGIEALLKECKITDKEFVAGIMKYRERFMNLVNRGSMYSRNVYFIQYGLLGFSNKMIENSGKIFQKVVGRIMKKF